MGDDDVILHADILVSLVALADYSRLKANAVVGHNCASTVRRIWGLLGIARPRERSRTHSVGTTTIIVIRNGSWFGNS